jgi:hypothetical protein
VKKAIDIPLKVVLSLILLLPVVGLTGVMPPPTQDLYNTPEAFGFIETLNEIRYISIIMAGVHVIALVCLWTRRTGLAALLILPITVNVVAAALARCKPLNTTFPVRNERYASLDPRRRAKCTA